MGLTDREIRYAKVPAGLNQRELRDQKVQGLVLRVYKTGKRVWFVFYRRKEDNRRRYLKLGAYPGISLAQARELAEVELGKIAAGEDPQADRAAARERTEVEVETVAELSELLLAAVRDRGILAVEKRGLVGGGFQRRRRGVA